MFAIISCGIILERRIVSYKSYVDSSTETIFVQYFFNQKIMHYNEKYGRVRQDVADGM